MRSCWSLLVCTAALFSSAVADARQRAFIGCPVIRDMAEPDRPCWLVEHQGELYYVGLQSDTIPPVDFYPPQLLHRTLFEGDVLEGPRICGGIPTRNVKLSPLPYIAPECNTILPQEGITPPKARKLSAPFAPGMRLAVKPTGAGRVYETSAQAPPQPPFKTKSFRIDFAFGDDFLHLAEGFIAARAVGYFNAIKGSKLTIGVYRDRVVLDNGDVMEEPVTVAKRRADRLHRVLTEWGIADASIDIRLNPQAAAGARYVELIVAP